MDERQRIAPAERQAARDLARRSDRLRRRQLHRLLTDVADDPAVENRLNEALMTEPGPEAAARVLFGAATRLIDELVAATGEDRDALVNRILR